MGQSEQTLSLRLINSRNRPFIAYYSGIEEVIALVDTGSLTPVWCMGAKKLIKAYPDAVKKGNEICIIEGFGQQPVQGEVYVIPRFELRSSTNVYRIVNLQVAVCKHPQIGCDFVLSDTMFSHADTLIVRRGEKRMDVISNKAEYQCTARYQGKRFTVLTWAQDEMTP